jgi:UDPglucose 6-dehydrogenase/GDP-mannose 6-dehydrogenase
MKIAVIGTGYVGLVSGVCLASRGNDVTCVDYNTKVVERLNQGSPHIFEKGLPELLTEVIAAGTFRATSDIDAVLSTHDVFIVAVGTPSEHGKIDLGQIGAVAKTLGTYIGKTDRYISVIIKSTVIPGTTDGFVRKTIEEHAGKPFGSFGLGMNPEFLREGEAVSDFIHPDRIVLGAEDEITKSRLEQIYAGWDTDKIHVNTRTAEMIKYANNTILASIISLNNELADLATLLGNIDYMDVVKGVSYDKRWSIIQDNGNRLIPGIIEYMKPGVGFGGSCFPKDVQAIRTQGMTEGLDMTMTNAVLSVNDQQVPLIMELLSKKASGFDGKKILLLGLAFKPGTDDIRDSSAIKILEILKRTKATIHYHDPIVEHPEKFASDHAQPVEAWTEKAVDADIIVIGTNWEEYLALKKMDEDGRLSGKLVFDSKRLFRKSDLQHTTYFTIG